MNLKSHKVTGGQKEFGEEALQTGNSKEIAESECRKDVDLMLLIPGPDRIITCYRRERRGRSLENAASARSRARGVHPFIIVRVIIRLGLLYLVYGPQVSFFVSRT